MIASIFKRRVNWTQRWATASITVAAFMFALSMSALAAPDAVKTDAKAPAANKVQAQAPAAKTEAPQAAETAPAKLSLTPVTAAELALHNSIDLQVDAQTLQEALGKLKQAEVAGKLTAGLGATVTWRGPVKSLNFGAASVSMGGVFNESEALSVSQPLYTGHRLEAQKELAKRGIDAARARPAATALATALAARDAGYTILRLTQLSDVASQRATATAEHLKLTQKLFEGGTVAKFEVVQAETELAKAQGDVIAAQVAVEQAKAALRNILVVPQTTEITMQDGVPPKQPEGALPKLVESGLQQRPEVALAEANVRIAEASVKLTKQSKNTSLGAFAQFDHQTVTASSSPLSWTAGLQLNKPLIDGGLQQGQVQEQEAKVREAKLNVNALKQQIALDVTQQYLAVGQAQSQLQVAEAGEVNARERLRIAQVRFESGVSLGIEVLDAQTALAVAEAATINARYDLQTATVRLRSAIGIDDVGGVREQ